MMMGWKAGNYSKVENLWEKGAKSGVFCRKKENLKFRGIKKIKGILNLHIFVDYGKINEFAYFCWL